MTGPLDKQVAKAYASLSQLRERLERGDADYAALIFSPPIEDAEIAAAEKRLGAKLPPSYVAFVKAHGCWKLASEAPKAKTPFAKIQGSRGLLTPTEMADITLEQRKAYRDEGEDEQADALDDSLMFQENFYRDNFVCFRVGSAKLYGGEMAIDHFYHDDRYEFGDAYEGMKPSKKPWLFLDHVCEFAEEVIADADE